MTSLHDERLLEGKGMEEGTRIAVNILGAAGAVAFVALISGLFLGLLTLDYMDLLIIQRASIDEDERLYATNLLPVVKDRHRLLVTLLIMNALAYETLPIFLDALVPSWLAVLLSTTLILLFGEIIPSGIFMGPQQLYLGNKVLGICKVFLWVLYPVAAPLGRWLDHLTETNDKETENDEEYNRSELTALVQIQHERRHKHPRFNGKNIRTVTASEYQDRCKNPTWSSLKTEIMEKVNEDEDAAAVEQLTPPLTSREVDMVQGALQFKTKLAMDVYTPYAHVYAVPDNLVLTKENITIIYSHGYSRVPVYRCNPSVETDKSAVLGFLITRQLMLIDWDDERLVSTLPLQRPTCVSPRMNLVDLFEVLQNDRPLMTFVCASPLLANKALESGQSIPVQAGYMGIVTLVDVMESILQDRIYDESDIHDRDRAVATLTRWAALKLQSFARKRAYEKRKLESNHSKISMQNGGTIVEANESTPLLDIC
eukprot:CAMPEP_0202505618 /NCGR_PEP_ID=MMETSP1361-20130828/47670_1 /ASSEMBLY_ACC=CAM_ASM_000849 /TAXON_ID=210615 /ORGANISM="Staurosira complex sp., Strain CCMP2646" /LENGTH=483 /DNA_ID=CAMNT_0049139383 /DNA_START=48 /DNA_END=1499 /DNA_ORIENTATION=-